MKQAIDAKAMMRAGFDGLVSAAAGDGRKLAALAVTARKISLRERSGDLARAALVAAPDDAEVRASARQTIAAEVPGWHFRMLHDEPRNTAFVAAIERAVTPGCHVIDIGTGSGLLAMIAARAGAGSVAACEMNATIAGVAREVVAANGFDDRVRVVTGKSTELEIEADLGGRADLIVSEIVSNNLISEGVLPTLADAAKRLLAPGGRMLPAGGDIMVALADWPAPPLDAVEGFDLSAFEQLVPIPRSAPPGDAELHLRSEPLPLFAFDFADGDTRPDHRASVTLTSDGGTVGGIAQWIRLRLDAEGAYENRPMAGAASHWSVQFYPFAAPIDAAAGTAIAAHGHHDGMRLLIWTDTTAGTGE